MCAGYNIFLGNNTAPTVRRYTMSLINYVGARRSLPRQPPIILRSAEQETVTIINTDWRAIRSTVWHLIDNVVVASGAIV